MSHTTLLGELDSKSKRDSVTTCVPGSGCFMSHTTLSGECESKVKGTVAQDVWPGAGRFMSHIAKNLSVFTYNH